MRFFNKLGNVAFSQLFTYLLQQPIKDTLCGTKVLWRARLRAHRGRARVLRRLRSVRRLRSHLRGRAPEPEDRRDPGALPRPHLRRDQHLSAGSTAVLLLRMSAIAAAQDQVRVSAIADRRRAARARTLERFDEHRRGLGRRTRRCARCTPTGTGASRAALPPPRRSGPRVELGSGPGFAREFIPGLELTDLVRGALARPRGQRRGAAVRAPRSVGALVLFDVLHHLPSPRRFFAEAARVLRAGRAHRDVRAVHQPAVVPGLQVPPRGAGRHARRSAGDGDAAAAATARDPFDSNQAIPTLLFGRARGRRSSARSRRWPSTASSAWRARAIPPRAASRAARSCRCRSSARCNVSKHGCRPSFSAPSDSEC